jgi:hypothetical protein
MKIFITEEQYKGLVIEFIQQAEKLYFNTNLIPDDIKNEILHITGGDNFTRLVCDIVYHFKKYSGRDDNYETELKMGKEFHDLLVGYDKNLFPVKHDLLQYGAEGYPNERHVLSLFGILRERKYLINNFNRLPSIAIRNLSKLKKTTADHEYTFLMLDNKIKELIGCIKSIPNTDRGHSLLNKIFNSKNDLDQSLEVAKHFQHSFMPLNDESVENLINATHYLDANIVQNSNNVVVIRVNDPEAMETIGCMSLWCFARPNSEGYWDQYATRGYVYVIFDFKRDADESTFMMTYLPDSGSVYASSNVELSELGIDNSYKYLKKIGVKVEKLN